jgi:nitrate reductase gamma subunit
MTMIAYIAAYLGMAVFTIACIARILMWTKMPMHIRWELYPVPHEKGRAHYGGSYLEEVDWWKKPRETSLIGELRVMIPEILFLVALKEHNPAMWRRSFPFHFGLYLLIGCTLLMIGGAVLGLLSPTILSGGLGIVLEKGIMACGYIGLIMALWGALGLLQRRLTAPELKDFTSGADIFNLCFFILALGCTLAMLLMIDRDFERSRRFVQGLVSLQMTPLTGSRLETLWPTLSVVLLAALVAYIPLTHMSHFIGKYFAYHAIRWNDTPNLKGGDQEPVIQELLGRKVSWGAPHIRSNSNKSWVDVALDVKHEESKK